MKKNKFFKQFEDLDADLFEPISDEALSRLKGGYLTKFSIPTYWPGQGTQDDNSYIEDTPPPIPA